MRIEMELRSFPLFDEVKTRVTEWWVKRFGSNKRNRESSDDESEDNSKKFMAGNDDPSESSSSNATVIENGTVNGTENVTIIENETKMGENVNNDGHDHDMETPEN